MQILFCPRGHKWGKWELKGELKSEAFSEFRHAPKQLLQVLGLKTAILGCRKAREREREVNTICQCNLLICSSAHLPRVETNLPTSLHILASWKTEVCDVRSVPGENQIAAAFQSIDRSIELIHWLRKNEVK
jgi:hypothetical protein